MLKSKNVCVICKKKFMGKGNNPYPIKKKGKCCDECNLKEVVPTRINIMKRANEELQVELCDICKFEFPIDELDMDNGLLICKGCEGGKK